MSQDPDAVAGQDHAQGDHLSYPRSVVFGVVVMCVLTAGLTVWNMRTRLHIDIPSLGDGITSVEDYAKGILDQQDDQLRLQDSDQDGLNDYEELRVYGTSPFIADTDSDGLTDSQELAKNTDPNCPQGKTCNLTGGEFATASPSLNPANTNPYGGPDVSAVINDPAKIRELLIQGGADARMLETIDDQTLQLLAQQAYDATVKPTPEKLDIIKNLQPPQIRALLKERGFDETILKSITDDQLMAIFQQAYSEAVGSMANPSTPSN